MRTHLLGLAAVMLSTSSAFALGDDDLRRHSSGTLGTIALVLVSQLR